jgi:hypothetical protein
VETERSFNEWFGVFEVDKLFTGHKVVRPGNRAGSRKPRQTRALEVFGV